MQRNSSSLFGINKNLKLLIVAMMIILSFILIISNISFKSEIYESKKTVWVINKNNLKNLVLYQELDAGLSITNDFKELIKSEGVIEKAKNSMETADPKSKLPSIDSLSENINVSRRLNSRLMTVSFRNKNKRVAQDFLNELVKTFKAESYKILGVKNIFVIDDSNVSDESAIRIKNSDIYAGQKTEKGK